MITVVNQHASVGVAAGTVSVHTAAGLFDNHIVVVVTVNGTHPFGKLLFGFLGWGWSGGRRHG
jgi:hypothetical protein